VRFPPSEYSPSAYPTVPSPVGSVPLVWFAWASECSPSTVEPYGLGSPPPSFHRIFFGIDLGVFRSSGSERSTEVVRKRPPLPLGATSECTAVASPRAPRSLSFRRFCGANAHVGSVDLPRFRATRGFGDSSHGVRFLSAFEPGRSLCRFASPAPSALRVSHPLSGLIPPGPGGFVSRHIRP
jgi:hypothetical protein